MTVHPQFPYPLYLVISEVDCKGQNVLKVAEQAILGGVDVIQLREKNCSAYAFLEKAKRLKDVTNKYNVPLIINDNLEVAMEVDAIGIHVGNSDIPPIQVRERWHNAHKMVGYSIEYLDQLENEQTKVANYLGISPVFCTATKTDTVREWGLEGIATIRKMSEKPLVAIGGMHLGNIQSVIAAGVDSIAVVSAICGAGNPQQAAYNLKNEILK